jgi:hypothetical protein
MAPPISRLTQFLRAADQIHKDDPDTALDEAMTKIQKEAPELLPIVVKGEILSPQLAMIRMERQRRQQQG